jgi:hypothetical protein
MKLRPKDFMYPRYEVIERYPGCPFNVGSIQDANEFEGKEYLSAATKVYPSEFPLNFKKLRWWEHRTIEQLTSIEYMKVVSGSNYYGVGDIVEVIDIHYNDSKWVNGKDNILFNLKGHYFRASELEPSTKEEHDKFWNKNKVS